MDYKKVMDGLWKNWDELSKEEADSLTIRGLVHESSVAFAEKLLIIYQGNLMI